MSHSAAMELLGAPSRGISNTAFYLHEHALNIRNEPYILSNSVMVEYRDGALATIEVWQATVN